MVTGGTGGMEMAAVRSLHDVMHATVFQIIGISTFNNEEHVWHGLGGYSTEWGP